MYALAIVLLMLVLPVGSVLAENAHLQGTVSLLPLIGKWFVFWMVGIRLILAGLRQFFQPSFTSRQIFGIDSGDPLPIVRELGVANFSTGVAATASIIAPSFVLPMAIVGAIFYGIAGIRHVSDPDRNSKQNIAMISDLFACLVLAVFVVLTLLRLS